MSYYNYHAQCKKLINSSHVIGVSILAEYKKIKPALVFYFDNHKPMPIREYKWSEYLPLIKKLNLKINNNANIKLNN